MIACDQHLVRVRLRRKPIEKNLDFPHFPAFRKIAAMEQHVPFREIQQIVSGVSVGYKNESQNRKGLSGERC